MNLWEEYSPLFQDMNIPPMPTTTAWPTTPTIPPLPTTTKIQSSKKTHKSPVTAHDPETKTMATEETTHETTESDISKGINDSICLLYRII